MRKAKALERKKITRGTKRRRELHSTGSKGGSQVEEGRGGFPEGGIHLCEGGKEGSL